MRVDELTGLPALEDADFQRISELMFRVSGIRIEANKKMLVSGRLLKRLKALHLADFHSYVQRLQQDSAQEERRLVVDLLTTNETFFFREEAHFDFLRALIADHPGASWRMWSAACSSGEEVYSLAMLMDQLLPGSQRWHLLGSDICRHALETASSAIYPLSRAKGVPDAMLRRYCLRGVGEMEGFLQIQPILRQQVSFRCINLNQPLPGDLPLFDVVFLRNILIYFDQVGKKTLLDRVLNRLHPGGYLFVGHSESLYGMDLPLTPCGSAVYFREEA